MSLRQAWRDASDVEQLYVRNVGKDNSKMYESGIFNVLDYGMATGNSGTVNQGYLQALVDLLLNSDGPTLGCGGTISFPSVGTFEIEGDIIIGGTLSSPPNSPFSLIFAGTGQQEITTPNLRQSMAGDTFVIKTNPSSGPGDENICGITFQEISL